MLTGALGHFRILRLLGQGGMGEVYLAEDTKLGRQVALKVLPQDLAADAGRRERFEREARAIASLNHPNIVVVHSIEQAEGTSFLTMEYVEGKPLADLILKQGLPLDRLLKIAIPLADAVGAAHHRGVVHRDLKPANVMVTTDNRVKVLDFGLAKLQEDVSAREGLPTQELTGEGRIVGTVAYMSPEQAEGRTVDQRTDVFSLGVLLYEMATGQRPFTGDTSLSVLSSILRETPRPVAELRPDLPRDFSRIVRRALNKDPEQRYQSAKDLRNDLTAVLEDLTSGELARPASAAGTSAARVIPRKMLGVTAIALVAGAAAGIYYFVGSSSSEPTPTLTDVWTPARLTSGGNLIPIVAVAPDGRYVAFVQGSDAGQRLVLRQIATGSDIVVREPEQVRFDGVTFSRDGSFIYYTTYPAGDNFASLYRVAAIGGAPQKVLANLDGPVAFSPDGARMAFIVDYPSEQRSTIEVANADGSGRRSLTERKRPDRFPVTPGRLAWSPDGATIAAPVLVGEAGAVALLDVASGASRLLGENRWAAVGGVEWLPNGRDLIVAVREEGSASTQLRRVDTKSGAETQITRDLFNYMDLGITADGRAIAATAGLGESTLWVAEAARVADLTQATTDAADGEGAAGVAWSEDGSYIYTSRASGNPDLWSLDPRTGLRRQLTSDPADDAQPAISPDGKLLAFVSRRQGGSRIWFMNADGTEPRPLTKGPADAFPTWSSDGGSIVYLAGSDPHRATLAGNAQPLKGHWPPRPGDSARMFVPRAVSRQGLVAGFEEVDSQRGGGWRLAYAPLDGSAPVTVLDVTQGSSLGPIDWAADGQAIDIVRPQDRWNIWRYPIDGRAGYRLTNFVSLGIIRSFSWSPQGRLLASRGENKTDVVLFRGTDGH